MYQQPRPADKPAPQSPHTCDGSCDPDAWCACCLGECNCGLDDYQEPTFPPLRICNVPPGPEKVDSLSRREGTTRLWHPLDIRHEDVLRAGREPNRQPNGTDIIGGAVLFHGVVPPPAPMTAVEGCRLVWLEAAIMRDHPFGVATGAALVTIDAERLYRTSYREFQHYCADRWGLLMSRVWRLMESAEGGVA